MAAMKKIPLTPESIDLWWACMSDWEIDNFKDAAIRLLKTCQFMPQPSDFQELLKADEPTSGEAFAIARTWLVYSPYGYTVHPDTPPNIAAAIHAIGGADAIAICEMSKLHFVERRFCEHYEQITEAEETRHALPGIQGQLTQDA